MVDFIMKCVVQRRKNNMKFLLLAFLAPLFAVMFGAMTNDPVMVMFFLPIAILLIPLLYAEGKGLI